jgi:hypothetical protein
MPVSPVQYPVARLAMLGLGVRCDRERWTSHPDARGKSLEMTTMANWGDRDNLNQRSSTTGTSELRTTSTQTKSSEDEAEPSATAGRRSAEHRSGHCV